MTEPRALGDPVVLVRTLGTRRDFGSRRAFVLNLLAAGGIRSTAEHAPVAVLASSPHVYADQAADAVAELRAAGVQRILLAGRTDELGEHAHLVDDELYDGMDVVAFLDDLLDRLGAPAAGAGEQR